MGTLFLVATPIGNLEDITARAIRILAEVRLIAAEDTRQTRKLLSHYNLHTPMTSYHEHNKLAKLDVILAALGQGDVALVSDAGTPALNDPGMELVRAVLENDYKVSPIPGASAPVAALVASGLPTEAFLYLGYLPRRAVERRRLLGSVERNPYTLIFLETPHRLLVALEDLQAVLGDRQVAVARELTKLHEEIVRGRLSQVREHFQHSPPRGEITLVLAGSEPAEPQAWTDEHLRRSATEAIAAGEPPSRAASRLAVQSGRPRREIYRLLAEIQRQA